MCFLFLSNSSQGSSVEQLDELSVVGHPDEPEPAALFESSGLFTVLFVVCFCYLNIPGIWFCSNVTVVPTYPHIIGSKSYGRYVKMQIIMNAIYRV
jgi:hypothetical protein